MSDLPQAPFEKLAMSLFELLQKNQMVLGLAATWNELRPDQKEIFYKHARELPRELTDEITAYIASIEEFMKKDDLKGG